MQMRALHEPMMGRAVELQSVGIILWTRLGACRLVAEFNLGRDKFPAFSDN